MTIYGFIDEDISHPCTVSKFVGKHSGVVEEIIDDPITEILLTDFGGGIPLSRFLKGKHFRNTVLYHLSDRPKINICGFTSLKGGFSTKEECQFQIEKDAEKIYKM